MKKAIILFLLAIPTILLIHFNERAHHSLPNWLIFLSAAPFFLTLITTKDPDQDMFGEASASVGNWLLLLLGVGGMLFGVVGFSLRDTSAVLGLFGWVLPFAMVVTVVAMMRILRK
ncbi:hypothetical protein QN372_01655 [Undibacterium sp. RTI2.1]|uniref:hypothetical protein n=1 Tax=unclassified Undibacterium TaxID=2630295 RepID=UPI002AB3CAA4|nr:MULTISPECIES: hypothetical protein [unclassified Undibacterium]MDY7539770.1 hypothetical protein [Undibacterium sp. 5I1]MEB0029444.1 hypothetical protein [Undibacterium sp. RTI2.1]MEB0115937.1 hypothetical protein [Undibacterium sp. RTI2.2]MEB0232435.1 hypothetical protein [Undibacterium sp. 10I3]MEB0256805.1 hypothetical protein [Undibacterium sp. 5I1]